MPLQYLPADCPAIVMGDRYPTELGIGIGVFSFPGEPSADRPGVCHRSVRRRHVLCGSGSEQIAADGIVSKAETGIVEHIDVQQTFAYVAGGPVPCILDLAIDDQCS